MKQLKAFKPRTEGATPIQKWNNLVNRWNSCATNPNNPYSQQRMIFTKAEVNDLFDAYPELKDTVNLYQELDEYQIEALKFGDYPFMDGFSFNSPKPVVIEGYTLID